MLIVRRYQTLPRDIACYECLSMKVDTTFQGKVNFCSDKCRELYLKRLERRLEYERELERKFLLEVWDNNNNNNEKKT